MEWPHRKAYSALIWITTCMKDRLEANSQSHLPRAKSEKSERKGSPIAYRFGGVTALQLASDAAILDAIHLGILHLLIGFFLLWVRLVQGGRRVGLLVGLIIIV